MELLSLKNFSISAKVALLEELGYRCEGRFVLSNDGTKVFDKYINQPVLVDNMVILPGSTIVLDDNPLSIASYIEEYGEVL
ncbi:MAG TPA: hypothetical protein VJK07_03285 [Candidatus Nanoarchaeia archaeon]|nr:hypothetical protein [Candidatus Nanoarchaeia archaeon]